MLVALPNVAQAHITNSTGSFSSGLTHPVVGLDHMAAMVAVGIIGARIGRHAVWKLPTTFVGSMIVGALLGMLKVPVPLVEGMITASVLVLGIFIFSFKTIPEKMILAAVAFFALFHGHAHGSEMAMTPRFVIGFVLSTSFLHVTGILIGQFANRMGVARKKPAPLHLVQ